MTRRLFLAACGSLASPLMGSGIPRAGRVTDQSAASRSAAPAGRVLVLRSVAGVSPDIVGTFREPAAFQQARSGQFFVFDRKGHAVYAIDKAMTTSWKVVQIGREAGRILEPTAFALAPDGTFAVADQPAVMERVQLFEAGGTLLGGFTLPGRPFESVTIDGMVMNGVGSLQYGGGSIYVNQPETGALVSEYTIRGYIARTFGTLRQTGQEADRDVHLALNTGMPLVNPRGGFYFVFQAGVPTFRKLSDDGTLVFERHVEGPELDDTIKNLPTVWPRRKGGGDRLVPVVRPVIRTAAVDAAGSLWVVFAGLPYTYVYNSLGERTAVVQFRAAGALNPSGLFFAPDGRLLVAPGCYVFDGLR